MSISNGYKLKNEMVFDKNLTNSKEAMEISSSKWVMNCKIKWFLTNILQQSWKKNKLAVQLALAK